jgi:pectate lyase
MGVDVDLRQCMLAIGAAGALVVGAASSATAEPAGDVGRPGELGRQVLAPTDGWAAAEGGTTGGAAAGVRNVYHVHTWQEFRAALGGDAARGDTTATGVIG